MTPPSLSNSEATTDSSEGASLTEAPSPVRYIPRKPRTLGGMRTLATSRNHRRGGPCRFSSSGARSWAPLPYPKERNRVTKTVGQQHVGKPRVRIERGMGNQDRTGHLRPGRPMSRPLVVWDPRMLGYDLGGQP